jgi:ADP-ribosyl-[dinitrogen reductase] hydrolase
MAGIGVEQRALGAFLGVAAGDALGATVEFMTPREIADKHGVHNKMIGGGWLKLAPGEVTDDTEMSLALARSLVRRNGLDLHDVCTEFGKWLATGPKDVGNTCRRGIRRFMTHGSVQGVMNDGDAGNGAAMRCLPVALATWGHRDRLVEWMLGQCRTTHHHPLSDEVSVALGEMVHALLDGRGQEDIRPLADALAARHRDLRFDPFSGLSSAYIVDTAKVVFDGYFQTRSFEECLVRTVNRGGDADTTGAIVGMLGGATWGVDGIPRPWLKKLDRKVVAEIEELTPRLLALAARG